MTEIPIEILIEPAVPVTIEVGELVPVAITVGASGPPGRAGHDTGQITRTAATVLSGHRVVTTDADGNVVYASADVDLIGPFWVTTGAAIQGADVTCVALGPVDEPSWTWAPHTALYLGLNGALTAVAPTAGLLVRVATAITPTSIFVDPTTPILLA